MPWDTCPAWLGPPRSEGMSEEPVQEAKPGGWEGLGAGAGRRLR